jgi:RimJ/RimL family protein N-acetyltransferase
MPMKIDHIAYTRETLDLSSTWLRDPEIKALTSTPAFSREDQIKWFEGLPAREDYRAWTVRANSNPIGAFGIKNILAGSGEYWGYIGEKHHWGKGIGRHMLCAAVEEAKRIPLKTLLLRVHYSNFRAINLYIAYGFRIFSIANDGHYCMRLRIDGDPAMTTSPKG